MDFGENNYLNTLLCTIDNDYIVHSVMARFSVITCTQCDLCLRLNFDVWFLSPRTGFLSILYSINVTYNILLPSERSVRTVSWHCTLHTYQIRFYEQISEQYRNEKFEYYTFVQLLPCPRARATEIQYPFNSYHFCTPRGLAHFLIRLFA